MSEILNSSSWDRLVMMRPENCAGRSGDKAVIDWLANTYGAKAMEMDFSPYKVSDLVQLSQAHMLIEDKSAISYWATVLSNATHKHVSSYYHQKNTHDDPAYIVHEQRPAAHASTPPATSRSPAKEKERDVESKPSDVVGNFSYSRPVVPMYDAAKYRKAIHEMSGPICLEQSGGINHACVYSKPCGNYDFWYDEIYNNVTVPQNDSARKRVSYFTSPWARIHPNKVVLSMAHNGFGNQLFQHYFAQRLAEHMHIPMYMTTVGGPYLPPNTDSGSKYNKLAADPRLLWSNLPEDHPAKELCRHSNFTYGRRPVDLRQHSADKENKFAASLTSFLDPDGAVKCLISVGYFQDKGICTHTAKRMWPALADRGSALFAPRVEFGPRDLTIHFRCAEKHYKAPSEKKCHITCVLPLIILYYVVLI
jgi:hypothetical protein